MCENLDTICGSSGEKKGEEGEEGGGVKGGKERSYFQFIKVLQGVERCG